MTENTFKNLGLSKELVHNLETLGYNSMTPVQALCLPHVLNHKDLIIQAETGSGKTATFGLGIAAKVNSNQMSVQSLVLCPTRELAEQVSQEIRRLARCIPNMKVLTLCGGTPIRSQIESLAYGAHVIVGTPGRILDLLHRELLDFSTLNTLVLDEADRMLDMGFADAIDNLIKQLPKKRQTLLFSATYPDTIKQMSSRYQRNAQEYKVQSQNTQQNIHQLFYKCAPDDKIEVTQKILQHFAPESTLIFCNTKEFCKEVAAKLYKSGINALALHGDLDQYERNSILARFASKSVSVLVATDVAARGLDIDDLELVLICDLSAEPKVHTHRIGRTARAGKKGRAVSLCAANDAKKIAEIEEELGKRITYSDLGKLEASDKRIVAPMVCVQINGGKKNKLRAGDILGALTSPGGLKSSLIQKITIFDTHTLVAVQNSLGSAAVEHLNRSPIKNMRFKARLLS